MNAEQTDPLVRVSQIVDRERRARRISQQSLAKRIGVSHRTLQRCLARERTFKVEELLKIARVFNRKPEDLYAEAG